MFFRLLPVEIGAASDCVVPKVFLGLLIAKVFQGVGPQQVTHGPECWGLLEPVQLGHTHTHTQKNRPTKSLCAVILNNVTNTHVHTCAHPVRAEDLHGNPYHTGGRRMSHQQIHHGNTAIRWGNVSLCSCYVSVYYMPGSTSLCSAVNVHLFHKYLKWICVCICAGQSVFMLWTEATAVITYIVINIDTKQLGEKNRLLRKLSNSNW